MSTIFLQFVDKNLPKLRNNALNYGSEPEGNRVIKSLSY